MALFLLISFTITVCIFFIVGMINKTLVSSSLKLQEQLLIKTRETDILYKIITHIYKQLSLLKLKECPEEEFKNIPFEIIEWIEQLMGEQKMNDENEK